MIINNININAAAAGQPSRAAQAAKDFEAMFTSMMFKAMRGSGQQKDSLIPKSMGEEIFTEMLDGEYARLSAENGSLGLAALILKEIERSEGKNLPSADSAQSMLAMERRGIPRRVSSPYSSADSTRLINRINTQWEPLISNISDRFGVDKDLVTAVIARESAGNPRAISPKGAKGLMQLMDGTAREMGVAYSFSPAENIMGGVKYLKKMLDLHNGDETLALASYNAGPGAVKRFNGVPPYKETREYVKAVLNLRAKSVEMAARESVNNENNITETNNGGAI